MSLELRRPSSLTRNASFPWPWGLAYKKPHQVDHLSPSSCITPAFSASSAAHFHGKMLFESRTCGGIRQVRAPPPSPTSWGVKLLTVGSSESDEKQPGRLFVCFCCFFFSFLMVRYWAKEPDCPWVIYSLVGKLAKNFSTVQILSLLINPIKKWRFLDHKLNSEQ